jgi:hypothetical protein
VGRHHKAFTGRISDDSIHTAFLETEERSPRSLALPRDDNGVDYLNVQVGWVGVIKHLKGAHLAIAYPPYYLETKERSPRSLTLPRDDNGVDYLNVEIG